MSKVFIEESTLSAIGDAIREKAGTNELISPLNMAQAITDLPSGGGELPEEALNLTGDLSYKFRNNGWNWFIEQYGKQIKTSGVTSLSNCFYGSSKLKEIPFAINCSNVSMIYAFYTCKSLLELPDIYANKVADLQQMCTGCASIRTIPDSWVNWDLTSVQTSNSMSLSTMFYECYSLRYLPEEFLKKLFSNPSSSYSSMYYYFIASCCSLDEIRSIGVSNQTKALTSNAFYSTFNNCGRLKAVTFDTQEDGSPIVAMWKSQVIDLSSYVGYLSKTSYSSYVDKVLNYNSGITADKQVTDDASYQALKDDPDWFTTDINYSRYNHDSAVETLISLPDCSATGTNTIKFKGASGALTDGGAINTLTEEEIAVATAKGWTVTLA